MRIKPIQVALLVLLGFCFIGTLLAIPIAITQNLLFGWTSFIHRVCTQMTVRVDGIVAFIVSTGVAVTLFHVLARSFVRTSRERQKTEASPRLWTLRCSLATVFAILSIFLVGIAMTGIVHQLVWLVQSPEPFFLSTTQSQSDSQMSLYRAGQLSEHKGTGWILPALIFIPDIPPEYDSSYPWNDPRNAKGFRTVVPSMLCPSQSGPIWSADGFGLSHVAGNDRIFHGQGPVRLGDFVRGANETIMFGEVNAGFVPWGSPLNTRPPGLGVRASWTGTKPGKVGYGSKHPAGTWFGMVDGSVRSFSDQTDPTVLDQLSRVK